MGANEESLAHVYANALLDLAFQKGVHAEVLAELREFRRILEQDASFAAFLGTPSIRQQVKKDVIRKVFGKRVSDPTLHFLQVVIDKRRQAALPAIIDAFVAGYHERLGELVVKVESAVPLEGSQRDRLTRTLKQKYDKEIVLEERVDPRLLGGLVLRVGDSRTDGSLRTRLRTIGDRLAATRFRSEDYYED